MQGTTGVDVGMLVMAVVASIVSRRAEARLPAKRERVAGGPRVFRERKYVWKAVRVEFCQLNKWRARGQRGWLVFARVIVEGTGVSRLGKKVS